MTSAAGGVWLFLGPDRPRKLQRLQELERTLGIQVFDRHRCDAAALAPEDLLALCRQQPAASPLRLIVVDQAQRLERASVEALQAHAETIAAVACVLLLVETELSARHPLALAQRSGMRVEAFDARSAPAAKPFAFTDALGRRDAAAALAAAHEQLLGGKEPLELLGLVGWQLNRWVMVRRLLQLGCVADRIETLTSLRAWQIQRVQSETAGRSLTDLHRLLERCWQLDVDAKSGRILPQLALEQLIIEICAGDPGEGSLRRGALPREPAHQAGLRARGGIAVDDAD